MYTFVVTIVLLLSVSGAILVRSIIIRRRHRQMVDLAIRNGTYVPPTPPARPARVDMSEKPELWEAYLGGGGGWQLGSFGHGSGKELRGWESIKPIYAGYAEPLTSIPYSGSSPNLTSLSPPVYIPATTPINPSGSRGDDEENRRTAEVSTGTTIPLLTRARIFLNTNSTVPASSSADIGTNSRANISMTEPSSNSPPTLRVAVLIAMPSPSSSSHGSSIITPLSASLSSPLSSQSQPTTSHLLQLSPSPTSRITDDEEQPLPHLEMGVTNVVIGRSENSSSWDSADTKEGRKDYLQSTK